MPTPVNANSSFGIDASSEPATPLRSLSVEDESNCVNEEAFRPEITPRQIIVLVIIALVSIGAISYGLYQFFLPDEPPPFPIRIAKERNIFEGTHSTVRAAWHDALRRVEGVRPFTRHHMVFQRGHHSFKELPDLPGYLPKDRPLTRPIENTIASFAAVWQMGIDLAECDVQLTRDNELVMFHDDTLERFQDGAQGLPKISEQLLNELQGIDLIDPSNYLNDTSITVETRKEWVKIPTLGEVLKVARSMGPQKRLLVEIKAWDDSRSFLVGQAVANWVKQNEELAEHIATVMSYSERALVGYHEAGATHNPNFDDISLMLMTVKPEDATEMYQKNPINCYNGMHWTINGKAGKKDMQDWVKPPHLDGYYLEVTIRDQLDWIENSGGKCENVLGVALGAWSYPAELLPFKKGDKKEEYQTLSAADVEDSVFFLAHAMGLNYVNTDFPREYSWKGYKTFNNRTTNAKRLVAFDMSWPKVYLDTLDELG